MFLKMLGTSAPLAPRSTAKWVSPAAAAGGVAGSWTATSELIDASTATNRKFLARRTSPLRPLREFSALLVSVCVGLSEAPHGVVLAARG